MIAIAQTHKKMPDGTIILNSCTESNFLLNHPLFKFLKLKYNPTKIRIDCSHGVYLGKNWCQGILAVSKKSQPHPKGSDNDCSTKVTFTNNIGITNEIHNIKPKGNKEPAVFKNASLLFTGNFESRTPLEDITYKIAGIITRAVSHTIKA